MRIVFVAGELGVGGAERHMAALAGALVERGHQVSVASLKRSDALLPDLIRRGVWNVHSCQSFGSMDPMAVRCLRNFLRTEKADVAVAISQYALAMSVMAAGSGHRAMPVIGICHSMDLVQRGWRDRLRFSMYGKAYGWADRVVYVSDLQRRYFRQLGVRPRSDEVIHNGVDLDWFDLGRVALEAGAVRRQAHAGPGTLLVGLCGAFREEKKQGDLVQALRRLRDRGRSAKALFIGDGPLRAAVADLARSLDVQDDVVFVGAQQDVRPYMAACDVIALTSHTETFPMAVLESMALRRPVVASQVGGLTEQIDDCRTGLLFQPGNIDALVECLLRVDTPTSREELGRAARAAVEERFSQTTMVDRYVQCCERVVERHREAVR